MASRKFPHQYQSLRLLSLASTNLWQQLLFVMAVLARGFLCSEKVASLVQFVFTPQAKRLFTSVLQSNVHLSLEFQLLTPVVRRVGKA